MFKRLAILGGGPSAMFLFKKIIESGNTNFNITIFEKNNALGSGMPYSTEGALEEHVTNVSSNEIPELLTSVDEWIKSAPEDLINRFKINRENFNEYKVLPRLLFGVYLSDQFKSLLNKSSALNIESVVHYNSEVIDVEDDVLSKQVKVFTSNGRTYLFDKVVVCIGHTWPKRHEDEIDGYFDSPYPPSKIAKQFNFPVALKGSSLTAIDAIRTLARNNGRFGTDENGNVNYTLDKESKDFRMVMHSRNGLLPAVRIHLGDTHFYNPDVLTHREIKAHRVENRGFLSLDFVFEYNYKRLLKKKSPLFYEKIKQLGLEEFVEMVMEERERLDPFVLLEAELAEAEKSIETERSVFWKELLGVLSFEMNYPAKYFSAEDMLRLKNVLMPLISIVISFAPQSSVKELLLLNRCGVLDIVEVGEDSEVKITEDEKMVFCDKISGKNITKAYKAFVNCVGQAHLSLKEFPFRSLVRNNTISQAKIRFRDSENGKKYRNNKEVVKDKLGNYYLIVSGLAINDNFQVLDKDDVVNDRIYIMAVPYIGGFNPDYSGLDFCEAAADLISEKIFDA